MFTRLCYGVIFNSVSYTKYLVCLAFSKCTFEYFFLKKPHIYMMLCKLIFILTTQHKFTLCLSFHLTFWNFARNMFFAGLILAFKFILFRLTLREWTLGNITDTRKCHHILRINQLDIMKQNYAYDLYVDLNFWLVCRWLFRLTISTKSIDLLNYTRQKSPADAHLNGYF